MPRVRLETDFTSFKHGIITATAKVEKASKSGMTLAVLKLMDDCLTVPPTCPRKTGSLAASHSAFVDGQLVGTTESVGHVGGTGATPLMHLAKISTKLEGAVVAHKPYAAAQHEGVAGRYRVEKYSHPELNPGPKWMYAKLVMFGEKYFTYIASSIKALK